jgi:hypothetical protein
MKRQIASILDKVGLKASAKSIATALGLHHTKEHGHEFMVRELNRRAEIGEDLRGKLLVEIGTTREDVPGLGSTKILGELCRKYGMRMITVDMDEENTDRARRQMAGSENMFSAVCSKGEDFLQNFSDKIDFIYLDAFDFEHPNHSDKRKSKYELVLGTTINNAACHKMHLDCAVEIIRLRTPLTTIVFDDVWQEAGVWKGKGETAMPYLLLNGFALTTEGENSAVLRPN